MATYKVIQDIEAEDKIVGPLTLRQLIYAGIAALCGYISFLCITRGVAFLLVVFAPIMLFCIFFAIPWGRDQSTEVWALAKIRFLVKPRRRIWDQTGAQELVHITAPKQIERIYTNQLSPTEVNSRLSALANTLDSRGWAVKNTSTNLATPSTTVILPPSDRLVDPSNMPQSVSNVDVSPSDDMLDEVNNARAQQLDQMVHASEQTRRQQVVAQINQPLLPPPPPPPPPGKAGKHKKLRHGKTRTASPQLPPPADYWFLKNNVSQPQAVSYVAQPQQPLQNSQQAWSPPAAAAPTPDEAALAEQLKAERAKATMAPYNQHMKTIQPPGVQTSPTVQPPPVTPPPNPATMELANNNDLNIATIARIVNKQDQNPDEVVISLHEHSSKGG